MRWIKMIPIHILVKYLPEILAYILTKVLGYLLTKQPTKAEKILETVKDLTHAMAEAAEFAKDGIITKEEIAAQKASWAEVFR